MKKPKTTTNKIRRITTNPPKNPDIGGKDLSGDVYGNFLVLSFDHRDKASGTAWWKVKCTECGTIRAAHHSSVTGNPERCMCYKVHKDNPDRVYRIGEKLQKRLDEEAAKLNPPPKPVIYTSFKNLPHFEFSIDSVKQAIVDLREDRKAYGKASADWRNKGISSNRDMTSWRQDMEVREDNVLFRILDMIEELQNELKQKP